MKHSMENPTYRSWQMMKTRCNNPNYNRYHDYGGRGITVCAEWENSFTAFVADMGERPANKILDRINNAKGYFKENCRWATLSESQKNTRRSVLTAAHLLRIKEFRQNFKGSDRAAARILAKELQIKMETIREVFKGRTQA